MIPGNDPEDISMRCPTTEVLAAFLDGHLATEERALVEKHLIVCAKCRLTLSTALKSTDIVSPPDGPED
jgi:predicted anti-sigma-YlaC factor YlaD